MRKKENANMIQAIKQHEQLNKNTDHNKTFEKQKKLDKLRSLLEI